MEMLHMVTHLRKEHGMINEDAVNAFLLRVEEANIFAKDIDDNRCVPCVGVLIVPARRSRFVFRDTPVSKARDAFFNCVLD